MILMRVGEHQAGEVFALFHQIADVGQNQIDAGQMLLRRERHAEVDREPGAAALVADAVDRQVHADLADAAQRREHQFLCARAMVSAPPKPKTSPAVTVVSAAGLLEQQSPGLIEPLEAARNLALRQSHLQRLRQDRPRA